MNTPRIHNNDLATTLNIYLNKKSFKISELYNPKSDPKSKSKENTKILRHVGLIKKSAEIPVLTKTISYVEFRQNPHLFMPCHQKKPVFQTKEFSGWKNKNIFFHSFWVVINSKRSQSHECIDKERSIITVQVMAPCFIQFLYLPHILIHSFRIYREFKGKPSYGWKLVIFVCITNALAYFICVVVCYEVPHGYF